MAASEKNLPLAIGLNLLLPDLGYIYMGRIATGIIGGLIVAAILLTTGIGIILPVWLGLNVLMAIDMVILHNKRKKEITEATTMKCPQCAETIQREAKVCRFCHVGLA